MVTVGLGLGGGDVEHLPMWAAWRHLGLRDGFEVAFFATEHDGIRIRGATSAVEAGQAWQVTYDVALDHQWRTRSAVVHALAADGPRTARVDCDQAGRWRVDGVPAAALDGCVDIDLESSAVTNTIPVHRLTLAAGQGADVPAAYVRTGLEVARLNQHYHRAADQDGSQIYEYRAPEFDFAAQLRFAPDGLVADYPGIAQRF